MMGDSPARQPLLFWYEPQVPETRFQKKLALAAEAFDWEAVRARAAAWFDPTLGRPSWDPVLIVKLLLIHKLFGLRSFALTLEFAADSLACRDFLGLQPDGDGLPSPQSLSDWRARLGPEFFEDLLGDVVLHCVRAGMVLSDTRVVDATMVAARVSADGPRLWLPEAPCEALAWLEAVCAEPAEEPAPRTLSDSDRQPPAEPPARRVRSVRPRDPEARLQRKHGGKAIFSQQVSLCSDPHSGLVVSVITKPTEEPQTMVEHVDLDPGTVSVLVADSLYDAADPLAELVARGVQPVVPAKDRRRRGQFGPEHFYYDPDDDCFTCPAGARLPLVGVRPDGQRHYRASRHACRGCRLKRWCTASAARGVSRQANEPGRAKTLRSGRRHRTLMGYRRTQEHLWRMAKRDYGLAQADGLGTASLQIQAALVAICINLSKLATFRAHPRRGEGQGVGLRGLQPSASRRPPRPRSRPNPVAGRRWRQAAGRLGRQRF